ncbi:hypothetical protein HUJ05_006720 [Dendroctonus ponderosae]|nr:hypothetical protein HUJ05_006720 [Dendroctonus ponderosae]
MKRCCRDSISSMFSGLLSRGLWEFLPDVSSTTAVDIIKGDEAVGEVISRACRLRLRLSLSRYHCQCYYCELHVVVVTGGKHSTNPPKSDASNSDTTVATSNQINKGNISS